ncbi:MAG: hypothetical protein J1G38_00650 [Clostridiales bacterium]|nr:hypothetical protein [Clostridiales bacterium]
MAVKLKNKSLIIAAIAILVLVGTLVMIFTRPEKKLAAADAQEFSSIGGKQVFEAESGTTTGEGWVIFQSRDCSSQRVLSAMGRFDGSAVYTIKSDKAVRAEMSLKMSYIGSSVNMREVLSISVNGTPVDLDYAAVYRTCSDYKTFFEFPVGTVELRGGDNTVTVTNVGGGYSIDYFAISPILNYTGKALVIEAEDAVVDGSAYPQERAGASGGRVLDNRTGGRIIFALNSNNAALTALKLRFGYSSDLNGSHVSDICNISVNGRSLANEIALEKSSSKEVGFYEYTVGNLLLRAGENKIVIENRNGGVFYDSIALTDEIKTEFVGESLTVGAESAACAGGSRVEYANGKAVIAFNSATTSAQFLIYSQSAQAAALQLSLAYWGIADALDEVLFVTVNGYLLDLSEIPSAPSALETEDKYYDFQTHLLGDITLEAGCNIVSVTSIGSTYNVEGITVSK